MKDLEGKVLDIMAKCGILLLVGLTVAGLAAMFTICVKGLVGG